MAKKINEMLLTALFDECEVYLNNDGTVYDVYLPWDTYEQATEYYWSKYDFTERVFNNTKEHLENLLYGAEFYDDHGLYLQLHDNHTFWNMGPTAYDDFEIMAILDDAVEGFEKETGIEVFGLGRSGRHICVDFNLHNLENYDKLVDTALKWESWFIKQCDANPPKED